MKQLNIFILLLAVLFTKQAVSQSSVTAQYPTNDNYYGWFQVKNKSGDRGFYLGHGNGKDIVNFTLDKASKLYLNNGDLYVGGANNGSIFTRHINGKDYKSAGVDHLYLNYNKGKHVYVGNWNAASNATKSTLYVQGQVYTRHGWFRTYEGRGLYSQSYNIRFYPHKGGTATNPQYYWTVASDRGIQFKNRELDKVSGYVYHSGDHFGLLDGDHNWAVLVKRDDYISMRVNNVEQLNMRNGSAKFTGDLQLTGGNLSLNHDLEFKEDGEWSGRVYSGTGPALGPYDDEEVGTMDFRFKNEAATEGASTVLHLSPTRVNMKAEEIYVDGLVSSKYKHEDSDNYVEVGFQDNDGQFKIGVEDDNFAGNNFNIFNLNPSTKKIGIGGNQDSETYIYGKLIIKRNPNANDLAAVNIPSGFSPTEEDYNWYGRADYVFSEDYQLKPLTEVETFIKKNKHLPGVKSALDITMEGYDVLEETNVLLEKVEELTLYIIDQQKQIDKLKGLVNISKED